MHNIVLLTFFAAVFISLSNCQSNNEGQQYDDVVSAKSTAVLTTSDKDKEIEILKEESFYVEYTLSGELLECVTLTATSDQGLIDLPPPVLLCPKQDDVNDDVSTRVLYNSTKHGIAVIEIVASPGTAVDTSDAYVKVYVGLSSGVITTSNIFGWVYTIAWDASFVPQIVHNWRRKSVMGLSFDFLTLNLIGFSFYFLYNAGLLWIPGIQDQYYIQNPTSVLHVRINDVIFPLYALLCTSITIVQCFFLERGNQRVSNPCRIISVLLLIAAIMFAILTACLDDLLWINMLYFFSYEKLLITCIKYFPQLYLNYANKSTAGWSIWQVILDFTGGTFSLLQMFLLAANYHDWHSVLTDPAKLGLGLLSIIFNILFFIQHYCLYRGNSGTPEPMSTEKNSSDYQTFD